MQDGRGLLHQNRGFLAMPRIYDLDRMGSPPFSHRRCRVRRLLPVSLGRSPQAGRNRAAGKGLTPRNRLRSETAISLLIILD
jgi:hypothetical protein